MAASAVVATAGLRADEPAPEQPSTLTGNWAARAKLESAGVRPFAELTTEAWANVDGGLKTGAWWNQLLDFGLDLDLEKFGGGKGSCIVAEVHWVQNSRNDRSFSDYTGAFNPISGIAARDHVRVYNFFYRQAWQDDSFVIKAGQLAADDDFMLSDYAGLFINSSFGAMPSQADRPSFPVWPVAAPGLFVSGRPLEPLYLQAGVYYGQPGADVDSNWGFDWAQDSDPSVAVVYEAGLNYKLCGRAATARLGGTFHSGQVEDFAAINRGNLEATESGTYSFYAIHDLMLLTRKEGAPALAAFWRGGIKPDGDHHLVSAYTDAGLNWFGPLPGRPNDVAGVAVGYTAFGSEFRKLTGDAVASNETTVELAYNAQITRWLCLQADVQWLFNPAVSVASGSRDTATVVGVRAHLSF